MNSVVSISGQSVEFALSHDARNGIDEIARIASDRFMITHFGFGSNRNPLPCSLHQLRGERISGTTESLRRFSLRHELHNLAIVRTADPIAERFSEFGVDFPTATLAGGFGRH